MALIADYLLSRPLVLYVSSQRHSPLGRRIYWMLEIDGAVGNIPLHLVPVSLAKVSVVAVGTAYGVKWKLHEQPMLECFYRHRFAADLEALRPPYAN